MTMEFFLLFELAFNVVVLVLLVSLMRGALQKEHVIDTHGARVAHGSGLATQATRVDERADVDQQHAAPQPRPMPTAVPEPRRRRRFFRRTAKRSAPDLNTLVAAADAREMAAERELRARLAQFREGAERRAGSMT